MNRMTDQTDIFENDQEQESFYEKGLKLMESAGMFLKLSRRREKYMQAARLFEQAGSFRDSARLKSECEAAAAKAGEEELARRYAVAVSNLNDPDYPDYEKLEKELLSLGDYRDSRELLRVCGEKQAARKKKRSRRRAAFWIAAALIAAGIAWLILSGFIHVVMGAAYEKAGMANYALASYRKLAGRFDGEARYAACEMRALRSAKEGDTVTFGAYRWKVLDRKTKKQTVLLLATGIDHEHDFYGVPFEAAPEQPAGQTSAGEASPGPDGQVSWETSSLRAWLNDEIYHDGFTDEERELILPCDRKESVNRIYQTTYAAATDYLAPLSAEEYEKYSENAGSSGGDCWIRTPGNSAGTVCFVSASNLVRFYGLPASELLSVRPAVLLSLA